MSRVGKAPIPIPKGVKVELQNGAFHVEGPKGKLSQTLVEGVDVEIEDGEVTVRRRGETGPERARHGLMRALLANAVTGASQGFEKKLQVVGVGYRGEVKGQELHLSLGFSHPVVYAVPAGITVDIDKQNVITVSGADKQRVGQVAAEIRSLRRPDPYKGKGVRYFGETLRLKVGKASGS
ncbi:MAG TPA: 50S ribosomal protein L6 [Thermoanaerobaculia bacterium]|nr:50S ribosomal protein L6 [Thermoanaerobaculia bacterium]